ncbi:MAG: cell division topological specificity factor MinE [Alphaproteobacteria bacterium]|nr:cell division topological specificity factor MinE [Alphaproteobacteria bacterium]
MRGIFKKFQDTVFGAPPASKDDAKQRLKVLLIHDQVALTPAQLDAMREEIMDVISRYVEVDDNGVEFRLSREDGAISLVSNVPVRRVTARASA